MVPRAIQPGAGWDYIKGSSAVQARALGLSLAIALMPYPARAADVAVPVLTLDLLVLLIVLAAGALAIAGGLWGLAERRTTVALRESLRATTSKARALLSARDAWLSAGRESLIASASPRACDPNTHAARAPCLRSSGRRDVRKVSSPLIEGEVTRPRVARATQARA